jgi:hypothetical protein
MRATIRCIVFALSAVALVSCKKEEAERTTEPAASVDKAAHIDPALAKAVAAASAMAARAAPQASGGPPPNGVFPPGGADREIVRGAAPKLTVGGAGAEPRFALGSPQPKPGWKTSGAIQLTLQLDPRQGGFPLDVALSLEATKASAPADGGAGASPVAVTARVTGAKIGVTGVPRELEERFAALKGTRVSYLVAPDGSGSDYKSEISAGATELKDHVRVLVDALALVTLPRPTEPLGVGAIWMATSREDVFGLDLVTYRLVKVEQISAESVTLSVGTKRYATSTQFNMDGLRPDDPHELLEFQSKGDGRLTLAIGSPFPQSGELQSLLAAALGEGGKQKGMLQVQSRVGLDFRPR